MARTRPQGYSIWQIGLHWAVALMVIFQFLAHDGMEHAWDAWRDGKTVGQGDASLANFHAIVGIAILVLALCRLWLRWTRGAPPLPEREHPALKFVANATHFLIYALIVLLPLSGGAAWYGGIGGAAGFHALAQTVLFWLVIVHVVGAFAQHFVMKSDVLVRMLSPEAR